ncbi:hypothetical protein BT63DRAFT_411668 [Microthyrium microscopicum]|uniref:Uncharacterized protein n=1 Tax=Microthyrium microscopicum TaxID=703497 RepID=A0A6A6UJE3_9PEZI|nr:hypothetical protein BT63DRAFT_411668 [Microthyrium microscopicum]
MPSTPFVQLSQLTSMRKPCTTSVNLANWRLRPSQCAFPCAPKALPSPSLIDKLLASKGKVVAGVAVVGVLGLAWLKHTERLQAKSAKNARSNSSESKLPTLAQEPLVKSSLFSRNPFKESSPPTSDDDTDTDWTVTTSSRPQASNNSPSSPKDIVWIPTNWQWILAPITSTAIFILDATPIPIISSIVVLLSHIIPVRHITDTLRSTIKRIHSSFTSKRRRITSDDHSLDDLDRVCNWRDSFLAERAAGKARLQRDLRDELVSEHFAHLKEQRRKCIVDDLALRRRKTRWDATDSAHNSEWSETPDRSRTSSPEPEKVVEIVGEQAVEAIDQTKAYFAEFKAILEKNKRLQEEEVLEERLQMNEARFLQPCTAATKNLHWGNQQDVAKGHIGGSCVPIKMSGQIYYGLKGFLV